jgi:predicted nucleic acid-binding protein
VTWIVDAAVTVAYLLGDATEAEREATLGGAHAPDLVDVEVTHTLRSLLRASKIDLVTAELSRDELRQLAVRRHPPRCSLLGRSWELRDVCTTYDALYVALAEAPSAPRSSPRRPACPRRERDRRHRTERLTTCDDCYRLKMEI